ncbi:MULTISPECIES: YggS family pyridoxal phosphate-dependent enzyme [unclassified Acinetobacter]|uniref:YggS family pyridoxal phosphate-dependent enzyme n=1 Tax=unclassified Acinetobacter TaxID=196816 RepID=UPI002448A498|nr:MULTISPECIES: YggS family pyridoxal phosphate-dependent enzyme [unclassified Acinetobacter]MDH0030919.1 YggS family pyridoxal phosphate-dependent enzyme [Acinetobacter sp. GD04021]MDH0886491.1 YggS family pyridoxal phosphate-dependent enzyme [Acinetobacter sp. GD03873]MDH1083071.1 YggS family pyridoxal phosphate-dependent enzyme [Acinetobacter sp. GD03983]MDH2189968.1 YggS family pyridoxal phosphate-dependent enzyme [Acinetobacter sp. GD03645]MDH2203250.1 YggS family pyridoxal phosphate-dep
MNQSQQSRQSVLDQIQLACERVQRDPASVQLLAVSKTHPSQSLRDMYQAGQRSFGENYLQEALTKIDELQDLEIEWHFIGHVQRNKTKHLAEKFDWVHGVDRLIIAERLSSQRLETQEPLNICIQVNIDWQDSKDGCQPNEVAELVQQISQLPNIRLRGLMVIPAPENSAAFADAKTLFEQVRSQHARPQDWDTLSMGMSGDLDAAIAAGSTMVRVGTALFGARDYHH